MSKSMETKLSIREKAQLTAHLAICKTCSFCYRQFKSIRKTLVNYADAIFAHPDPNDHKLSDEATARMTRHLTKKSD